MLRVHRPYVDDQSQYNMHTTDSRHIYAYSLVLRMPTGFLTELITDHLASRLNAASAL